MLSRLADGGFFGHGLIKGVLVPNSSYAVIIDHATDKRYTRLRRDGSANPIKLSGHLWDLIGHGNQPQAHQLVALYAVRIEKRKDQGRIFVERFQGISKFAAVCG